MLFVHPVYSRRYHCGVPSSHYDRSPSTSKTISVTNFEERENDYHLQFDLPGVNHSAVSVEVHDNSVLNIQATRSIGSSEQKMDRTFRFDPNEVDVSNITSNVADGVLTILIPKRPSPEPVDISLSNENAPSPTEDVWTVSVDIPGAKTVSVQQLGSVVTLKAERQRGRFTEHTRRSWELPHSVNVAELAAYLKDGVLVLQAPRNHQSESHVTIPVSNGTMMIVDEKENDVAVETVVEESNAKAASGSTDEKEWETVVEEADEENAM